MKKIIMLVVLMFAFQGCSERQLNDPKDVPPSDIKVEVQPVCIKVDMGLHNYYYTITLNSNRYIVITSGNGGLAICPETK